MCGLSRQIKLFCSGEVANDPEINKINFINAVTISTHPLLPYGLTSTNYIHTQQHENILFIYYARGAEMMF